MNVSRACERTSVDASIRVHSAHTLGMRVCAQIASTQEALRTARDRRENSAHTNGAPNPVTSLYLFPVSDFIKASTLSLSPKTRSYADRHTAPTVVGVVLSGFSVSPGPFALPRFLSNASACEFVRILGGGKVS